MSGETFTCVDCGNRFEWSYGEQRYFREHNLVAPKRCPSCRSRRRAEGDDGKRGLSGSTAQPLPAAAASTKPASKIAPAPRELPLLQDLPRSDYYRYVSRFARMKASELSAMPVREAALLLQWMFEQHGSETCAATAEERRIDLTLDNRELGWHEYARIYLDENAIPVSAMWTLLNDSEDKGFERIHFCTTGTFPQAQKQLRYEFSPAPEILEGPQLEQYLLDAQQRFRAALDRRSQTGLPSTRPPANWWSRLKQTLCDWLGFGK
jgi:hypothetical protein